MKVKCYSVRLESLIEISDKCYKACAFNGTEALIPKSQVYGEDWNVEKCEAYWISAWILEQKELQYSEKKWAWFDKDSRGMLPKTTHITHKPLTVSEEPVHDRSLER